MNKEELDKELMGLTGVWAMLLLWQEKIELPLDPEDKLLAAKLETASHVFECIQINAAKGERIAEKALRLLEKSDADR